MRWRATTAAAIGMTIALAVLARGRLRRFAIVEESMSPSLEPGDWVIARRRRRLLERGDIVVLPAPNGRDMHLVKRVIGLPGEGIGIEHGRVTIGGALLADRWARGITRPDGRWSIPDDAVWVLSDNRVATAYDGRTFGPTPADQIDWVIVARYHPVGRAGLLR